MPDGWDPLDFFLMGESMTWVELRRGGWGYSRSIAWGQYVRVFFDGRSGMGVHVEVSGQGCRELEGAGVVGSWSEFLEGMLALGGKVTRLDVAVDDKPTPPGSGPSMRSGERENGCSSESTVWPGGGQLDLDVMISASRARELTCRARTVRYQESWQLGEPVIGRTLYFGSAASEKQVRVYDKAAEQFAKGKVEGQDLGHWVRLELECRSATAQALAVELVNRGGDMSVVAGVLRSFLEFKQDEGRDGSRSRWSIAPWWEAFLGGVAKLRLAMQPSERTIEQVLDWVRRQVAPSLALLTLANGGAVDWLHAMIGKGRDRLTARHLMLLGASG